LPGTFEACLRLLEEQLEGGEWSDAIAKVVIADHWVRYCTVPWSDDLSAPAERLAHARQLMSDVFADSMSDWVLSVSDTRPGHGCLASALHTSLLTAIKDIAQRHGLKLSSVQPQLIAAYNSWGHALPSTSAVAWFVTLQHGSLAALRKGSAGIDRVHSVRIGADWARELKRLQTFGRLANGNPGEGKVYVDLPVPLHALRPDLGSGLEWLEESELPMTTLHQLESLRRSVA
jgi:hypothetical protein